MTDATLSRGLFRIPVLGWVARDIARDPDSVWYALVILLTLLILAFKTWGLVALTLAAVGMVPLMFVILIAITQG
jgi:hypothetical protein